MKTLLTLIGIALTLCAHAQTYKMVTTDRYDKTGTLKSHTVAYKSGKLRVTETQVQIDTTTYQVIAAGRAEQADEGYTTRELILSRPAHSTLIRAILLISPTGTVTDLVFKKPQTHIAYSL